jgi:hypothetical protein
MLTGECFCGAVKYQINGDLDLMYHCHCSSCRKSSGASFVTNASFDASTFSLIEGHDLISDVDRGSHHRYHCSKCHSWVYGDSDQYPGVKFIPCGTLNEAPKKTVDHHVWVDSKAAWTKINDELPQHAESQPR